MPVTLRLADFSDHDLLFALEEAADEEGWATSQEIADQIGIDNEHPASNVGIRLGWLYRFGVMDKEFEKGATRWRLNDKGYALLHPNKLTPAAERALESLDESQRLLVTESVSRQLQKTSREGTHMARRAWTHNMGAWRDASIAPKRKSE